MRSSDPSGQRGRDARMPPPIHSRRSGAFAKPPRRSWPPDRWDPLLVRHGMPRSSPRKADLQPGLRPGAYDLPQRAGASSGAPKRWLAADAATFASIYAELWPASRGCHLYFDLDGRCGGASGSMACEPPCPGVACFARFGAGRVPRPFTLRTLKTVTARKARLTCADAGLPCTAAPAARRAPAARCAPVTAQPCAGSPAALRWQQGSPARQQGCWAGSAAPPDLRQPWAVSRLPCGQPPLLPRTTLSETKLRSSNLALPWGVLRGIFYKRRDRHSPEPPERPAGAPGRPGARGRLSAPHL